MTITRDGSTYATGKLIPDAFSILLIPATVIGNRFTIRSKTSSGIIPFDVHLSNELMDPTYFLDKY